MHSFRNVLGESPETLRKLCISTKFHTRKLGEIKVIYEIKIINRYAPRQEHVLLVEDSFSV